MGWHHRLPDRFLLNHVNYFTGDLSTIRARVGCLLPGVVYRQPQRRIACCPRRRPTRRDLVAGVAAVHVEMPPRHPLARTLPGEEKTSQARVPSRADVDISRGGRRKESGGGDNIVRVFCEMARRYVNIYNSAKTATMCVSGGEFSRM